MILLSAFKQYKGLPKEIYIIAFQRLISSLGGFVYPFLTLFLSAKIGLGSGMIGALMLISSIVGIPGSVISGMLIDRYNRKSIMLVSRIGSALVLLACGFMEPTIAIAYMVILANFIGSFAGPAGNAMTSDLTTPENRKQSFSLLYLGMNVGLAVGFLLAGYLFENYWRWLFIGDGLTSIVSLMLLVFFVKETKPSDEEISTINFSDREGEKAVEGSVFHALLQRPLLIMFVIINSLIGFVYYQHGFIMPLQLESLFPKSGSVLFGNIMLVNTLIVIFFTPIIMSLTKEIKPIVNVIIATVTYVIGFGMLAFADNMTWFYVSVVIWTIGEIVAAVNTGTYIANHSPVNHRGRFASSIGLIQFAGRAFAPLMMGLYLESHNKSEGWLLTGAVAIVCTVMLYMLYRKENSIQKTKKLEYELES